MAKRVRLVGINHVALEVGDIDEALAFYGRIFEIELRGRLPRMAFIDMGDQFIALAQVGGREPGSPEASSAKLFQRPDEARHFGLVVDDREAVRAALDEAGVRILPGRGLDFLDPWGNQIQIVDYADIQFTKTEDVLGGMGLEGLEKTPEALKELREKGLG
jgi:lactoylglutathione lyase